MHSVGELARGGSVSVAVAVSDMIGETPQVTCDTFRSYANVKLGVGKGL